MGLFSEYMDAKGTIKKPKVDISGGKPSPESPPDKPPKEHGKAPYIAKGEKNGKKGLGDLGDTKFDHSKEPAAAKIPVAEQAEIAALVTDAMKQDASLVEQLVYQLRSKNLLGSIVAEMLNYKETYQHISEVMSHDSYGPKVCSKLVRAMSEEVAPPMSASLAGQDIEDSPEESDEFGDEFDQEFAGEMEGDEEMMGDDMDMDFEMEGEPEMDPMNPPQAADPFQEDPQQQQQPPQQPNFPLPPQARAMKHFQRAMMRRQ